jgi:hypothetical protein
MKMRWCCFGITPVCVSLLCSFPAAAGQAYRTDLVGGMTLRSAVSDQARLDSPGGGVRLDFGRHLGYGLWLLGTVAWTRIDGASFEDCPDCIQTDSANSVLAGMMLRYILPLPDVEMFIQAGPGFLVDILLHSSTDGEDPSAGLNRQAAFVGSIGLGFALSRDFTIGFRADTLLGQDLDALSLGCYAGYLFEASDPK